MLKFISILLILLACTWAWSKIKSWFQEQVAAAKVEAVPDLDAALESEDPSDAPDGGKPLVFEYQDASGNVSTRQVTAWDYDGTYITGHCATANAERTFRHDRIVDFISGEELLDASHGDGEPVIGFLGFDPEYTLELEQTAEEEDLILRRYLAADLTHLCVGPHLDAGAIEEARALGLQVITEAQFDELLEER